MVGERPLRLRHVRGLGDLEPRRPERGAGLAAEVVAGRHHQNEARLALTGKLSHSKGFVGPKGSGL